MDKDTKVKEQIEIGDVVIKFTDLGLDFYVDEKKVCWINKKGIQSLKKFLNKIKITK